MFPVKASAKASKRKNRTFAARGLAALVGALACSLLALAALASASSPKRTYRGHTAQKRPVRVALTGRHVKLLRFTARLKCRDGSVLIDQESGFQPTSLGKGASFSDVQVGNTDTVRFHGRLHRGAVRGKLRVSDRVGHVRCDSGWVRFAAKAGG